MSENIYLSSDELERWEAGEFDYGDVCQHPREVRVLTAGAWLVIDLDHVLFGDKDAAVALAGDAARAGLWVGIHTFYPEDPRLDPLRGEPNIAVAQRHAEVRKALHHKIQQQCVGHVVRHPVHPKKEVTNVRDHPVETGTGP